MLSLDDRLIIDIDSKDLCINNIVDSFKSNIINYVNLGIRGYDNVWEIQKKLHLLIKNNKIPSTVLFLEHEHVYTLGKNADRDFLLNKYSDVDVVQTDRGGQITYHGPGQLIGYPIINLNNYRKSITWFVNSIEQIIINTLKEFDINSSRKKGLPGVWVDDEKICAMGVRIAQWVTMHGFALNVNPNMKYFDGMIPCGILDYGVTSMENNIDNKLSFNHIIETLIREFNHVFNQ